MKKIFNKKSLIIILINIIMLVILFFIANFISYFFIINYPKEQGALKSPFSLKVKTVDYEYIKEHYPIRGYFGQEYKRNGIVMFGCSFAHQSFIDNDKTFNYKASKQLKRPVYNLGSPGASPQFAIMQVRSHEYDEIIKKCDYAIYVTIGEHVWRTHINSNGFPMNYCWPRLDVKNNDLVNHEYLFPYIEGSYFVRLMRDIFFFDIFINSKSKFINNKMVDFNKLHFLTLKRELEKINPNIKMILLTFPDEISDEYYIASPRLMDLNNQGIITINLLEYNVPLNRLDKKYYIPNDGHPSEYYWDEVRDLLINRLKILN